MNKDFRKSLRKKKGLQEFFRPLSSIEVEKRGLEGIIGLIRSQGAYQNPDGTWSCEGNINISNFDLLRIPIQFKAVRGYFDCSHNRLTSLKGVPETVGGGFYCGSNELSTLKYGPKKVGGDYDCSCNPLVSLEDLPQTIGGKVICDDINLVFGGYTDDHNTK